MDTDAASAFLTGRHQGILITLRRDGSPQSSNIVYDFADGIARISVTADRAKTVNLQRDQRAVLHVIGDSFWTYCSARGRVELSDVTASPGDAAGVELLALYDAVAPEPHPDPDEFFAAMVAERRLVIRFTPESFSGIV